MQMYQAVLAGDFRQTGKQWLLRQGERPVLLASERLKFHFPQPGPAVCVPMRLTEASALAARAKRDGLKAVVLYADASYAATLKV